MCAPRNPDSPPKNMTPGPLSAWTSFVLRKLWAATCSMACQATGSSITMVANHPEDKSSQVSSVTAANLFIVLRRAPMLMARFELARN